MALLEGHYNLEAAMLDRFSKISSYLSLEIPPPEYTRSLQE
jgi:hypothetical protein